MKLLINMFSVDIDKIFLFFTSLLWVYPVIYDPECIRYIFIKSKIL